MGTDTQATTYPVTNHPSGLKLTRTLISNAVVTSVVICTDILVVLQQPEAARQNPLQGAMDKVGAGLIRLGEDLKGAGEHLGGVFVGLGNKLHSTM